MQKLKIVLSSVGILLLIFSLGMLMGAVVYQALLNKQAESEGVKYTVQSDPMNTCVTFNNYQAYSVRKVLPTGEMDTTQQFGYGRNLDDLWMKAINMSKEGKDKYVIKDENQTICTSWHSFISYSVWSVVGGKNITKLVSFDNPDDAFAMAVVMGNDKIHPKIEGKKDDSKIEFQVRKEVTNGK